MAAELQKAFNPNEHLMQIKSSRGEQDYLPVQWRLVWFRAAFPEGAIETELLQLDLDRETEEEVSVWDAEKRKYQKVIKRANGFALFRAIVKDNQGGIATGTKSEKAASFPDFIEKAETGAIGRALAALGYGTQFTGDEWDEAHRIVDSPVDSGNDQPSSQPQKQRTPQQLPPPDASIKAANPGLQRAASAAKQRATDNGLNWGQILSESKITVFEDGKDIATINRLIDALISESKAS